MFLNDKKIIGYKIKTYRRIKGFTQAELAEKIGISEKHLSKIETGLHYPSISAFWLACDTLKIPISEFGINLHQDSENVLRKNLIKQLYSLNDTELEFLDTFLKNTLTKYTVKKRTKD